MSDERPILDVSPPVSPALAVFPGDTPPTRQVLLDMRAGAPLTLSTLHSTVHVGAHVDAPSHYGASAPAIEATDLSRCVGPCTVVRARPSGPGARLALADLELPAGGPDALDAPRLLLRTDSHPDPNAWTEDFAGLEPALVDALADAGIVLVGIDTPSVDLATSTDLPAHARFLARDVTILEGLVLRDVAPGPYELIALPLRLVGFDASPVRAVLRPR